MTSVKSIFRKDKSLDEIAELFNVAQFVSFRPENIPIQTYSRLIGYKPNAKFSTVRDALTNLYKTSIDQLINIRSFHPSDVHNNEFIYGLSSIDEAVSALHRLTNEGLFTIANETIDVKDGGVSGVLMGDVIEFSPDDTPRCVEKPEILSVTKSWGVALLKRVYGFEPEFPIQQNHRLEFSIHPKPCGWKHTHMVGWELETKIFKGISTNFSWPNQFSRFLGDKVFGLLIADVVGLPVPKSTVINRRVAPFTFGKITGTQEVWIRACPAIQTPGKFKTNRGWLDPFRLLENEDPTGKKIPSILSQSGVHPKYSGALIVALDTSLVIEGKAGEGESLMLRNSSPEKLPARVEQNVRELFNAAFEKLGPVHFEWVHDGNRAWIVQLHLGATKSLGNIIVPGEAASWHEFEISKGLEALRIYIDSLSPQTDGLLLKGDIGLTSHFAGVVRDKQIPARIITK